MTKAQEIKEKCKEAGITVGKMLRLAGLDRNLIFNWDKKEPYQFAAYEKMIKTIELVKNDQQKSSR